MASTPFFLGSVKVSAVQILPADTTSLKTLFTAGASGSKVNAIFVSSTDTSARDVQLVMTIGGTDYIIGTHTVPINTGNTNAAPALNLLSVSSISPAFAHDQDGNHHLLLPASATLRVRLASGAVTASRVINFIAQGGDF